MAEQSNVENEQSIQDLYYIVCLDAGVRSSVELDTTISVCTFEQTSHCLDFIRSQSNGARVILIVSKRLAQDIVPSINDLPHVFKIYIRGADGETSEQYQRFSKVSTN